MLGKELLLVYYAVSSSCVRSLVCVICVLMPPSILENQGAIGSWSWAHTCCMFSCELMQYRDQVEWAEQIVRYYSA